MTDHKHFEYNYEACRYLMTAILTKFSKRELKTNRQEIAAFLASEKAQRYTDYLDLDIQVIREKLGIVDDICYVCHQPFTSQEWEDRHTVDGLYDCHNYCCPECDDE